MKALSKPLSSPNRADKFPPPLMRFLRTNVGSRSRGRSRSSPMFYLRSKKRPPIETTQEPSSPKVTCIGQVRVRRRSANKNGGAAVKNSRRRRCWWLKRTLFCGKNSSRFRSKKKPFFRRVFCKWGLFFRSPCCCKDKEVDSFREYSYSNNNENIVAVATEEDGLFREYSYSNSKKNENYEEENVGDGSEENKRDFLLEVSSSSSPPKNALLLTRCRSAPYRSSSLGGRFWGSPLTENENEEKELEKPICENEEQENSKELDKSVENVENLKGIITGGGGGAVHPLVLTRCKSEPARKGERLMQRRLDIVINPCSQSNNNS